VLDRAADPAGDRPVVCRRTLPDLREEILGKADRYRGPKPSAPTARGTGRLLVL
jgi:hypothetical protein